MDVATKDDCRYHKRESTPLNFVLKKLDPVTGCWLQQAKFSVLDSKELQKLISLELPEPQTFEVVPDSDYRKLVKEFSLPMDGEAELAELECLIEGSYYNPNSHSGRELLLMIEGKKPLAAFVEVIPDDADLKIVPEERFKPFVEQGLVEKYEYKVALKGFENRWLRRVLYALPSQRWRFHAHEMLWRTAEKNGWNNGFELIEGFLLGYDEDIDPFFESHEILKTI